MKRHHLKEKAGEEQERSCEEERNSVFVNSVLRRIFCASLT